MKKLFIVANWKSNKTVAEAEEWIKQITDYRLQTSENLEVILCPPFTLFSLLKSKIYDLKSNVKLGAQDISPFPDGAYTGEISGRMLKDLSVEYVIIGHSERRKYFKETEQVLENKVNEALDANIIPIFCVQERTAPVPKGVKFLAYEPVFAIGTGNPDTPENSNEVARVLKERLNKDMVIIYGGSVTPENVKDFCQQENLNGVLPGGASLDPEKFSRIIENASKI